MSEAAGADKGVLTEAQLAGATYAGSGTGEGLVGERGGPGPGSGGRDGAGGGTCDMARRLQDALRSNVEVRRVSSEAQRALAPQGLAPGRGALLMWDGDWVQTSGQAGKGLAGVRQAIALEVAFAPPACRAQRMQGLVVIALDDGGTGARLALGRSGWRWSDLLGL